MKRTYDDKTIEKGRHGYWNAYGHFVYGRESVLEGRAGRQYLGGYETVEEAQAAHPDAKVIDYSTKLPPPTFSDTPPSWFDPGYAGEEW